MSSIVVDICSRKVQIRSTDNIDIQYYAKLRLWKKI